MSDATFEALKRQSFLQVLFKVARLANEEAIARARAAAKDDRIRVAHTRLFPFITFEGVRLTELADKLEISKQAVQQLVDELDDMGMTERVPDPTDGRAKLIRFSKKGKKALIQGLGVLGELERELAALVGSNDLTAAHETLIELLSALEGGHFDRHRESESKLARQAPRRR